MEFTFFTAFVFAPSFQLVFPCAPISNWGDESQKQGCFVKRLHIEILVIPLAGQLNQYLETQDFQYWNTVANSQGCYKSHFLEFVH